DALLAQVVDGLLHVARGLGQSLLAFHHADAGALAQRLHQICRDLRQPFLPRTARQSTCQSVVPHACAQTAPAACFWGSFSSSPPKDTVSLACCVSGAGRSRATRWPSSTASETMRAKSAMARMASSLPGIGYWIASGSQFVSTMPTMGMPRRLASATAIFSFLVSTTNMSLGSAFISLMPANVP